MSGITSFMRPVAAPFIVLLTTASMPNLALLPPIRFDARSEQRSPDEYAVSRAPYHIGLLCKHVQELGQLGDDWDGYGGIGPSPQAIGNVIQLLNELDAFAVLHLHQGSITPSPYGTVSLEWEVAYDFYLRIEVGDNLWTYFYQLGSKKGESEGNAVFPDASVLASLHDCLEALYGGPTTPDATAYTT